MLKKMYENSTMKDSWDFESYERVFDNQLNTAIAYVGHLERKNEETDLTSLLRFTVQLMSTMKLMKLENKKETYDNFLPVPKDSTNNLKYDIERANAYLGKFARMLGRDELQWSKTELQGYVIPKLENVVKALESEQANRRFEEEERRAIQEEKAKQAIEFLNEDYKEKNIL